MKKYFALLLCSSLLLASCKEEVVVNQKVVEEEKAEETMALQEVVIEEEEEEVIEESKAPEGMYFSELTGLPISLSLQNQRPIAVMVDNEILAYPHFGVAEADVVYEMINSLHNDRITRLMALVKDWGSIQQMGSIRSTRDTNIDLQAEWNSILCHDGASAISLPRFEKGYASQHISGTFSRVANGKATEFTEYILPGDLEANIAAMNIDREYNAFKPNVETHFQFVKYEGEEANLAEDLRTVNHVALPFPHNGSELRYNADTKTYDYYCYGSIHVDGEDNEVLSFKNVILQNIDMINTDGAGGHVAYNLIDSGKNGYYLSNGRLQEITWEKKDEMDITRYYDSEGNELQINRGNVYIGLVPTDSWANLIIE
ncbi:MAG: DUF3048 domain-containing protein [Solobacterium sp.]|nr:DUF3048 domain-containing protein [Solobacterium sp.]